MATLRNRNCQSARNNGSDACLVQTVIRTWADLDARLGDVFAALLEAVQHCQPGADANRSRWPASELWQIVRQEVEGDLFELHCHCEPDRVKAIHRAAHVQLLEKHIAGLVISRAALDGCEAALLPAFITGLSETLAEQINRYPEHFAEKLAAAKERYTFL
jgi:hypothetical protein